MTITAEHSSGRFDVSPAELRAALTKQLADGPDFLSLTEMMSEARAAVLDGFPGYVKARGRGADGGDECALLVGSRFRIAWVRAVKLSETPIPRRGVLNYALHVFVEDVATGARHHRLVVHMPSGVEGENGVRNNEQGKVYQASIGRLSSYVAELEGPVVITGDWNLSLRRIWVRIYLGQHFPGFVRTWRHDNLPELGTHGDRVIDFSLVRGFSVSTAQVVPDFGASDHRAIRETHTRKENTVTRGIYPAAKLLLIPPGENDPAIVPRIAILHVDAGNATSLHDYFATRSGGIESHFHVRKDGVVEQYRNIFRQADANLDANDFAVSIETQGFAAGEWTPLQLAAIKRLLVWLNAEAGIPLIKCTAWDGKGVGYHVQFGAPGHWTPVAKSCPGPDRIKQYNEVIIPWMKSLTAPAEAPDQVRETHVEKAHDHVLDAYRSLRLALEELALAGENRVQALAQVDDIRAVRRKLHTILDELPER